MREIHAVKKTLEFHGNESQNVSGESIGGAALIRGRHLLTFLSQLQRLFEGGAYSSKYGKRLMCGGDRWWERKGREVGVQTEDGVTRE